LVGQVREDFRNASAHENTHPGQSKGNVGWVRGAVVVAQEA